MIGLSTRPLETHPGEIVDGIRPISKDSFEPKRCYDLISEWIYPVPRNIDCSWHTVGDDLSKGVFVIAVPKQDSHEKRFLITKIIDGRKIRETQIGHVERRRDATAVRSVADLHQALHIGLTLGTTLLERIENLEALLYEHFKQSTEAVNSQQRREMVLGRIDKAVREEGLASKRCLVLSAIPTESVYARTLFTPHSGDSETVRSHLENPATLRQHGWDLRMQSNAKILRGEFVQVSDGVQKVLRLYKDGCLVFAAGHYLGSPWKNEPSIYAIALVEVVANFSRFYCQRILPDLSKPPKTIAFSLLRQLYLWFGYTEDRIPYIKLDGGRRVIDIKDT